MTQFLIRTFIRNYDRVTDGRVRGAYGKLAGAVGICCNVLLFAAKLVIGTLSNSVSITADAINNLSDASSSVVTLLGFKLSEKPADRDHPFGHARIEYLSGLVVALMIMVIGVELVKSSVQKILHPEPVTFSLVLVAVLVLSMAVKTWMAFFNRDMGRRIGSATLEATFMDSRNDVITTGAVLAAAVAAYFTHLNLDGWMGLGVACFILYSGLGIIRETVDPLLGEAPTAEKARYIGHKIMGYSGVLGVHDLIVHDYGPGRCFASVHVEMDSRLDVMVGHDLIDNIERDFAREDNIELVIHYDPVVVGDPVVDRTHAQVAQCLKCVDDRLTFHDFRMVKGPTHCNLIFDVVKPYDMKMSDEELRAKLEEELHKANPDFVLVMSIDSSYISAES